MKNPGQDWNSTSHFNLQDGYHIKNFSVIWATHFIHLCATCPPPPRLPYSPSWPRLRTMKWAAGVSVKNTHLTPPSFQCDQIAKHCLTEWGWRVACSIIEQSQKAERRDFFYLFSFNTCREVFIWQWSLDLGPWFLFTVWLLHHIKERSAGSGWAVSGRSQQRGSAISQIN